jgi:hypothetical protein
MDIQTKSAADTDRVRIRLSQDCPVTDRIGYTSHGYGSDMDAEIGLRLFYGYKITFINFVHI